jgi:hypothetical protein
MRKSGHDILLISLNDHWGQGQKDEVDGSLSLLRCAAATPLRQRAEATSQALRRFRPDWVSLQFVCFGYHPKGLGWRWNPVFADLGHLGKHRHLMLHELWIGPPPLRRLLIGWGQKWLIRDLKRRFRPDLVTTSINSYQNRLSRIGINAGVFPLFGNIPVGPRNDNHIAGLFRAAGCRMVQQPRGTYLNGVFFGTVHPDFKVEGLVQWLAELQSRPARPILLSMIGRTGSASKQLTKRITQSLPNIEVVLMGEHSEETISQALQFADFGINTGAPELLGKSGTAAAMREHGLPIVLGDGKLDSRFSKGNLPPVWQFSTLGTVTDLLNFQRVGDCEAGADHRAGELFHLFETTTHGPEWSPRPKEAQPETNRPVLP